MYIHTRILSAHARAQTALGKVMVMVEVCACFLSRVFVTVSVCMCVLLVLCALHRDVMLYYMFGIQVSYVRCVFTIHCGTDRVGENDQ